MKRALAISLSVTVCAAFLAVAATNEVTSVNIVGYTKVSVPDGLRMLSPVFWNGGNTLLEVMGSGGVSNNNQSLADTVYVFDPVAGWSTCWLYASAPYAGHWVSSTGVVDNLVLMPGDGVLYRSRAATTNTLLGEVESDAVVTNVVVGNSLQVLSYPYSCDTTLGAMTLTNGIPNNNQTLADTIYLFTPGVGWSTYWLYSSAPYTRQWVSGGGPANSVVLAAGDAFMLRSRSSTNQYWIESSPY